MKHAIHTLETYRETLERKKGAVRGRIAFVLITLVLVLCAISFGQTTTSLGLQFSYDSNAYRTYDAVPDYVTETSFSLARDIAGGPWSTRLFYEGNLNFFNEDEDRRFHDHTLGLAASRPLAWHEVVLGFGGNFSLSRNAALYEYANYAQGLAFANAKLPLGAAGASQIGYRIRYRSYENLAELTNLENYVFERVNFGLSSGTSFILQTSYGRKSYSSTSSGTPAPELPTHGHGHRGGGGGDGDEWESSTGSGGVPPASQWMGSAKVGQSVTPSTGLGIHYLRRVSLGADAPSAYPYGKLYSYRSEDEIFNDPYSFEGHEVGVEMTRLLPWQMSVKMGYDRYVKNYTYAARDLSGEPLPTGENRMDTQGIIWVSLRKAFSGRGALNGFQIYSEVLSITNESNDPYFDYDDTVLSLGTSLSF
jgi:hypothetical protein